MTPRIDIWSEEDEYDLVWEDGYDADVVQDGEGNEAANDLVL